MACGRALWADCDTSGAVAALEGFKPAPTLLVGTSPGHLHAYWPLRDWTACDLVEQGCRRLAHALGSDANVCDRARILRVPGTVNHKRSGERVALVHVDAVQPPTTWADVVGGDREDGPLTDPPRERPTPIATLPTIAPAVESPGTGHNPALERLADLLRSLPATIYVPALTGEHPDREGKVRCPLHAGGAEHTPSLHVYPGDGGWACFACPPPPGRTRLGGDALTLAGLLWGMNAPGDFPQLLRRLAGELLGERDAAA